MAGTFAPVPLAATSAAAWDQGVLQDFGSWMTSEQRRVYALCQRLLQDRDEADSATQDVFLKAYQALSKPGAAEIDDPARWLTRIAVNACMDRLRSRKWQFVEAQAVSRRRAGDPFEDPVHGARSGTEIFRGSGFPKAERVLGPIVRPPESGVYSAAF